jgi:predicted exporter
VKPLALFWLIIVLWIAGYNLYFWPQRATRIETNVLALLPTISQDPAEQQAIDRMSSSASKKMVIMLGGRDWAQLKQAEDQYLHDLQQPFTWQSIEYQVNTHLLDAFLQFYRQASPHLLSNAMRAHLESHSAAELAAQMWRDLHMPATPRLLSWQEDPLNLLGEWLHTRSQDMTLQPREGRLALQDPHTQIWYTFILLETQGSAFAMSTQEKVRVALQQADSRLQQRYQHISVNKSGMVLYADKATAQAEYEVSLIGTGSLLVIILMMGVVFRSGRPILLVVLSLLVGIGGGVAVSAWLYNKLHLLTLVFGSSLIGVAEDFGIHYLCSRLNGPPQPQGQLMRKLLLSLFLAMLTTVTAYFAMGLTPLPGLQQMAIFSAVGVLCAWMTVVCWFPLLDRGPLSAPQWISRFGRLRHAWPYVGNNGFTWSMLVICAVISLLGLTKLQVNDDLRQLQSADLALTKQHQEISQRLYLPGPAQFYLVQGADPEQLLQNEENLCRKLDQAIKHKYIHGYQAVSQWVPSLKQQKADDHLRQDKIDRGALAVLAKQQAMTPLHRGEFQPVTIEKWLQSPIAHLAKHQWLGKIGAEYRSVVVLQGLSLTAFPAMESIAAGSTSVRWVNHIAHISYLLATYRTMVSYTVSVGFGLVFLLLLPVFKQRTWRVVVPTLVASLLTLASLSLMGLALNLFHALAFLMILGIGIDYAIFLEAQQQEAKAMIAVTVGALGTLASFGLLALSQTPALFSFGITVLIGLIFVWSISPSFSAR